jgi:RNA polymerase sigma-70 factor, ECF subfamily
MCPPTTRRARLRTSRLGLHAHRRRYGLPYRCAGVAPVEPGRGGLDNSNRLTMRSIQDDGEPRRGPGLDEPALLLAARGGDEAAFGRLVEPYRGQLQAHCYTMLGSVQDAEDALQNALLNAWRGIAAFEARSSLRSWLYTIATNACLSMLRKRERRVLPIDLGPPADPHDGPREPLVESVWVEPYPDEMLGLGDGFAAPDARYEQRESVELAFVAALQHLPAHQRAVLILREVLGFSAAEVAGALDLTVPAVNSHLQRARKTVDQRLPAQSQQATLRSLGDAQIREIVEGYMDAWERTDVAAVVNMLAEDAAMAMPPMPLWFSGRDAIEAFIAKWPLAGDIRWRHVPTRANGQPAIGCYAWEDDKGAYLPRVLDVLTLRGGEIAAITSFVDGAIFARFGLPSTVAA